ncbi:MAG: winged helix-turn-helix domain-containing protein [Christensenellaceae bacterium]|jgi:transposase|nr:winged helix-turn-helix domain-containing protein [Christensenellaceae bacterium]
MSHKEIIKLTGFTKGSVCRLCSNYRTGGLVACNLNTAQTTKEITDLSRAEEKNALDSLSAMSANGKFLRVEEIAQRYYELTGITYKNTGFYRILKRHKWRKVKQRGQPPKKTTEEVIDSLKKLTLFFLKSFLRRED